ncbi:MAG: ECF transporter S component [candidate division Zixibacteria bacterium HGW-Zixibacteria-1]|nr:MAG: ECF transporter S component [candidate division Zixibacteria bacterium HGW-Zixibacteria-1]
MLGPRRIAYSSLFLALAILLPIVFHQFGMAGRIFLPMHIPILICGFIAGPVAGVIIGLLAPFLSHLLTSMPPAYAVPLMTMELPLYGLTAGLAYNKLKLNIYVALIAAMIIGRLAFALGLLILGKFIELPYGPLEFFAAGGAVVTGIPGIIIQIIIIPPIIAALKRAGNIS